MNFEPHIGSIKRLYFEVNPQCLRMSEYMSSNSYGESPGERATKVTNTVTVHSYTHRIGGFFFGGSFPKAYLYSEGWAHERLRR
jgi:hypothetical protein